MVKNLVGPPVVGEDFVGRKEELAEKHSSEPPGKDCVGVLQFSKYHKFCEAS